MSERLVVMFSGGLGSWATAKRVAERHGTDDLTLLFADVKREDDDLYRFVREGAENVGAELVTVCDGRTPFEVFHDDRFLGNARLANCSKLLKIKPCRDWLNENADPKTTRLFVGIDWTEIHRLPAIRKGWLPYRAEAPLTERPLIDKSQMCDWLEAEGLALPAGYGEGFPHNNCLNQGCVRGGKGYWALMLRVRRGVYLRTEREEQELRDHLGKDVTMLRDRFVRNGQEYVVPLTLREFRERIEAQPELDFGLEGEACGCFTEDTAETPRAAVA